MKRLFGSDNGSLVLCAFLILTLILSMIACGSGNSSQNDTVLPTLPALPDPPAFPTPPDPRYKIETIVEGELLRVVTINNARPSGSQSNWPGATYGNDFAAALSEIGKNYRIEKIDSIVYYAGSGSLTGEIYVHVYPRE